MDISTKFLKYSDTSKSNHMSLLSSLSRDTKHNISIDRFTSFGISPDFVTSNIRLCAVSCDNLDLFVYTLKSEECKHEHNLYIKAAENNSIKCFKYLYENVDLHGYLPPEDEDICCYVAEYGSLEILIYLHEKVDKFGNRCSWDKMTCRNAAEAGSLECLKYAHENGCPWDEETCSSATYNNSFECLQYAHKNGCPWDIDVIMGALHWDSLEMIKYIYENDQEIREGDIYGLDEDICSSAAEVDAINCLIFLHENGCLWDELTCSNAAEVGSIKCLKYAHENGAPWDELTCSNAAEAGSLECLRYAHENGCSWDKLTCSNATYSSSLECLKYAHENGCPWDERTCAYAAYSSSLECLKYAHENGCPWDERTCAYAAGSGSLECLKYAREGVDEFGIRETRSFENQRFSPCPWDEDTCSEAIRDGSFECLKYAHENGCPMNILAFSNRENDPLYRMRGYRHIMHEWDHIYNVPDKTLRDIIHDYLYKFGSSGSEYTDSDRSGLLEHLLDIYRNEPKSGLIINLRTNVIGSIKCLIYVYEIKYHKNREKSEDDCNTDYFWKNEDDSFSYESLEDSYTSE